MQVTPTTLKKITRRPQTEIAKSIPMPQQQKAKGYCLLCVGGEGTPACLRCDLDLTFLLSVVLPSPVVLVGEYIISQGR